LAEIVLGSGFVLYRWEGDEIRYLLLHSARHGDVGLPKGKLEPGEEEIAGACRETEEETGLPPSALTVHDWFSRTASYRLPDGRTKSVTYRLARTAIAQVTISMEHTRAEWLAYPAARAALRHENLRGLLDDAATYLKDPALYSGLTPEAARCMLEERFEPGAPVIGHSEQVAGMSRAMAEAWDGLDPDYVEAAAWLHDIGRSVTHGAEHTLLGFNLVVAEGYPGYAAPCLSHYVKGRSMTLLGGDPTLLRAMWEACDLDSFLPEERIIALADFLAVGDRRARLEERHADLCERYGPSRFFDSSLAIVEKLKSEFETRSAQSLYALLGISTHS